MTYDPTKPHDPRKEPDLISMGAGTENFLPPTSDPVEIIARLTNTGTPHTAEGFPIDPVTYTACMNYLRIRQVWPGYENDVNNQQVGAPFRGWVDPFNVATAAVLEGWWRPVDLFNTLRKLITGDEPDNIAYKSANYMDPAVLATMTFAKLLEDRYGKRAPGTGPGVVGG